jgi:anti-sigma factor RsiW
MNCYSTRAVLDLHAEERLTPTRAKSVATHLASCADCRAASAPYGEGVSLPQAVGKGPGKDFKARLAASLKAQRAETPAPMPAPKLEPWPRDLSGVAFASAALVLVALAIGWSGVPSQRDFGGDELAAGRTP